MKLFLDASGPTTHVGLLHKRQWAARYAAETSTLEALFAGVSYCLKQSKRSLEDVESFIYCDGPGSTLGLRLTLIALKTWRTLPQWTSAPLYAYHRLHIAAAIAIAQRAAIPPFHLITESRQKCWHCLKVVAPNDIATSPLSTLSSNDLTSLQGSIFYLPQRKLAQSLTIKAQRLNYDLDGLSELWGDSALFRSITVPKLSAETPVTYQHWHPERHR